MWRGGRPCEISLQLAAGVPSTGTDIPAPRQLQPCRALSPPRIRSDRPLGGGNVRKHIFPRASTGSSRAVAAAEAPHGARHITLLRTAAFPDHEAVMGGFTLTRAVVRGCA